MELEIKKTEPEGPDNQETDFPDEQAPVQKPKAPASTGKSSKSPEAEPQKPDFLIQPNASAVREKPGRVCCPAVSRQFGTICFHP